MQFQKLEESGISIPRDVKKISIQVDDSRKSESGSNSGTVGCTSVHDLNNAKERERGATLIHPKSQQKKQNTKVARILIKMLEQRKRIRLDELFMTKNKALEAHFKSLPADSIFQFFKARHNIFSISDQGYVSLYKNRPISVPPCANQISEASVSTTTSNSINLTKKQRKVWLRNNVIGILMEELKKEKIIHIDTLPNNSNGVIRAYFNGFSVASLFKFFQKRYTMFTISPGGYISLAKDHIVLGSSYASPVSVNMSTTALNFTKETIKPNFTVTENVILKKRRRRRRKRKFERMSSSVNDPILIQKDGATSVRKKMNTAVSKGNNIVSLNQNVLRITETGKNCDAGPISEANVNATALNFTNNTIEPNFTVTNDAILIKKEKKWMCENMNGSADNPILIEEDFSLITIKKKKNEEVSKGNNVVPPNQQVFSTIETGENCDAGSISETSVNVAASNFTKGTIEPNSTVPKDAISAMVEQRLRSNKVSSSVHNSLLALKGGVTSLRKEQKTNVEVSSDNNMMPPNQPAFHIVEIDGNYPGALRLPDRQIDSMCQYKKVLIWLFTTHQHEIIGTLVDQLKCFGPMDYLKLIQSSEKLNLTISALFWSFTADEKLHFFKSCPQYFCVNRNFISLSNIMQSSSEASVSSEGLSESASSSGVSNSATVRCESVGNVEFPGSERCVSLRNVRSLNTAVQGNSADEIVEKSKSSLLDTQPHDASTPLAGHHQEIIKTFLALLKVHKRVHILQLCKLCSMDRNEICKNFFQLFSYAEQLKFLKNYPQYFCVDNYNFVTISCTMESASDKFVPGKESSNSNPCANNLDVTGKPAQGIANGNDVNARRCRVTPHNDRHFNYSLPLNSTNKNPSILPSITSSDQEIVPQNPNTRELVRFFQTVLQSVVILHYEELFEKLNNLNQFVNRKSSSQLKFFEDHSDIFILHPKGFVSLSPFPRS